MSKPGDPTNPVEGEPNSWQCCKCDQLAMGDEVVTLAWDDKRIAACPKCGHSMTWECCGQGGGS